MGLQPCGQYVSSLQPHRLPLTWLFSPGNGSLVLYPHVIKDLKNPHVCDLLCVKTHVGFYLVSVQLRTHIVRKRAWFPSVKKNECRRRLS